MNPSEPLPYAPTYPRLAALYKATRDVHASLDLTETLNRVIEKAVGLVGAERGFINSFGKSDNLHESANYKLDFDSYLQLGGPILDDRIIISNTQDNQDPLPDFIQLKSPLTILTIPLKIEDEVLGVIYVDRAAHIGPFNADDLLLLEVFATQAAIAIRNAQKHKSMRQVDLEFMKLVSYKFSYQPSLIGALADFLLAGEGGPINDKQEGWLKIIRNLAAEALKIAHDFNGVTEIETGETPIEIDLVNVNDCVEEALTYPSTVIEAKKQIVTLDLPSPLLIHTERESLVKTLIILIDNACKLTSIGGKITITADVHDTFLRLAVVDSGEGFWPEHQAKLFNKFVPNYRSEYPDIGVDLYFAKRIVERLGGEIGVESEPGKGSTFWFTLPLVTE